MAAPPPAAFGGDRVFCNDPQSAGLPTAMGDLAALFLQNLYLQREAADDAAKPVIDAQAEKVRQVLEASNASQTRETNIREPRSVTRVPSEPYGVNENIANVRMKDVPILTGDKTDSVNIIEWISRILNLAESMKLTFDATVNLLIQSSSKKAANFINELKQEQKTLQQIIQNLEIRYLPNLDIEDECSSLIRKRNESIFEFYDRLRLTARIECKDEPDEALRKASVEDLLIENIHRVLNPSVKNALEERKMNRSLFGLPPLTSRELVSECYFLEKV
jgi:hypothetical protein